MKKVFLCLFINNSCSLSYIVFPIILSHVHVDFLKFINDLSIKM